MRIQVLAVSILLSATIPAIALPKTIKIHANNFASAAKGPAAGPSQYLHIEGKITDESQDDALADMDKVFVEPLSQNGRHVRISYISQIGGSGEFFFNLIAEPSDISSATALNQYIDDLKVQGFHKIPVRFQKITEILETVDLEIGLHPAGATDDSFKVEYETIQSFSYPGLGEWADSSNKLGFAFLSKQSEDFLNYLEYFTGGGASFQKFAQDILASNNVVLASFKPYLTLQDGSVIAPDTNGVAIFDLPFVRACWQKSFENGMCYKAH
jgi:hypothetical protein